MPVQIGMLLALSIVAGGGGFCLCGLQICLAGGFRTNCTKRDQLFQILLAAGGAFDAGGRVAHQTLKLMSALPAFVFKHGHEASLHNEAATRQREVDRIDNHHSNNYETARFPSGSRHRDGRSNTRSPTPRRGEAAHQMAYIRSDHVGGGVEAIRNHADVGAVGSAQGYAVSKNTIEYIPV